MPLLFILGILLLLAGLGVFLYSRKMPVERTVRTSYSSETQDLSAQVKAVRTAGLAVLALGILFVTMSCFTTVSTRNVGVLTEFGAPVDTLNNGLSTKLPWRKVYELDGAIQTDSYGGESSTKVRLGNEGTATVAHTVKWRIITEAGDELYRDYRTFDNIRDSHVTQETKAALNDVLGNFDPLAELDEAGDDTASTDNDAFGEQVAERLRERVGDQIEIQSVLIPLIEYDPKTQERLNALQEEYANTRIAEQAKETATAQAAANRELAASVSNDPNVLVARCLDTFDMMVRDGMQIPAAFSPCWPGGSNAGVVVPAPAAPKPAQ